MVCVKQRTLCSRTSGRLSDGGMFITDSQKQKQLCNLTEGFTTASRTDQSLPFQHQLSQASPGFQDKITFLKKIYFVFMCMSVLPGCAPQACLSPWGSEEDTRVPGTGALHGHNNWGRSLPTCLQQPVSPHFPAFLRSLLSHLRSHMTSKTFTSGSMIATPTLLPLAQTGIL